MTIHLEKLHLGTNGKQTSHSVNEVKSLFSLFIQSKWKITESDRNRWNQISVACWWTVTQGKNTQFSLLALHFSSLMEICLFAWVCGVCVCRRVIRVFSVTRVNQSMHVHGAIFYSRGEIFSLFAMCDYINANFRVIQERYLKKKSVPWDVRLSKMSPCCLSPQQEGYSVLLLHVHGKILREP